MKIKVEHNTYAPFSLVAERSEYDALPPVDTLQVDFTPVAVNPDRLAVAAYLAFGAYSSGEFVLPQKFSPATAEAMEQDSAPVQLRPYPVEYYPKALTVGQATASLSFELGALADGSALVVLPADRYNGMITSPNKLLVSSNAFLFDALGSEEAGIRARLAVAVLFAEDLGIDTFTVDGSSIAPTERQALVRLLSACRLGLAFTGL